ncbi:ATP synthase F1 subunit epsilon [Serpentinicella sp. ANB-PHB4]|uniref:ATP synthase F1 subunit epsilon n=1 Tax=Serpentinicella sp. ANB-PHB4 TaxID=3074076 RepID=UPI00285C7572|nr:ATP synthase F1 subunit epsilon [Serpentinicella sp. ANB-PHB4]MDR5659710.1 ATP synthase F1 subunit epsilon [Serpentinicella sp. ANB-PHB4]
MASKFRLEIVTPDRVFFDEEVTMVVVRTDDGDVGLMSDHIQMASRIPIGRVKIKKDGEILGASVASGFIKVGLDKTTIITDAAEWPDEIDPERAEAAKERAEKRLQQKTEDVNTRRAEIALNKALNRIYVRETFRK